MRRYVLYIVILMQIALIISLIKGIQQSRKSTLRIADMEETKKKLEDEKKKLEAESKYVESEYYLEKVARDELHLSKSGETVVIVPEDSTKYKVQGTKKEVDKKKSNWQRWWEVLSGRI